LFVKRIELRNNIEYYLVVKISKSFSIINISEFNKILARIIIIILVQVDIDLRNSI
jgi:hypothetical protein